jgi:hypothetical protein
MSEELITRTEDSAVAEMVERITESIVESRGALIAGRDAQIAAETAPLDSERESLLREHAAIGEKARKHESTLAAAARMAQFEADRLTLEGKSEEAAAKLREAEEAASAPANMRARQSEISARLESIENEKQVITRRAFEDWQAKLQSIIRAAEHGLFIELLDKSRDEMYAYQERHGLQGTLDRPFSFLVKDSHLQNLTAPDRSQEWNSGSRWYGGRR